MPPKELVCPAAMSKDTADTFEARPTAQNTSKVKPEMGIDQRKGVFVTQKTVSYRPDLGPLLRSTTRPVLSKGARQRGGGVLDNTVRLMPP